LAAGEAVFIIARNPQEDTKLPYLLRLLTGIAVRAITPSAFSTEVSRPTRSSSTSRSAERRTDSPIPTMASSVGRWVRPDLNPTKYESVAFTPNATITPGQDHDRRHAPPVQPRLLRVQQRHTKDGAPRHSAHHVLSRGRLAGHRGTISQARSALSGSGSYSLMSAWS
jgi:hypothetical protein